MDYTGRPYLKKEKKDSMKKFGFKELTDLKVKTESSMEGPEVRGTKVSGEPTSALISDLHVFIMACVHLYTCMCLHTG